MGVSVPGSTASPGMQGRLDALTQGTLLTSCPCTEVALCPHNEILYMHPCHVRATLPEHPLHQCCCIKVVHCMSSPEISTDIQGFMVALEHIHRAPLFPSLYIQATQQAHDSCTGEEEVGGLGPSTASQI